jgi:iron complex outermembrane receptor protein
VPDIVVTAQHRTESAQSVPIAVSAVSGDQLAKGGVASVQDLAGAVPGLVVSKSVSYGLAPIAIRGIGGPVGGGSLLTDQPVAVYADGVYVRALGQSVSDFLDVDNIQVLRGPQGTLYGRNSTAGALLISSKRPDLDRIGVDATVGYSSYDAFKTSGALNLPLVTDTLGLRLAASHGSGGDWARNTVDDRKFGGGSETSLRGTLRFRPTSGLTIDLIGEHSIATSRPAMLQLATVDLSAFSAGGALLYAGVPLVRRSDYEDVRDSNKVQVIGDLHTRSTSNNVTLNAEWKATDTLTLTSISGYRRFRVTGVQDTTPWIVGALPGSAGAAAWNGGPALSSANAPAYRLTNPEGNGSFALGWNQTDQLYRTISQELRLAATMGAIKWTAGLYYADEKVDGFVRIVNEQGGPPMLNIAGPVPVVGAAGLDLGFTTVQNRKVYAAYVDGTLEISPVLSLTAGLRYTKDDKNVSILNTTKTLRTSVFAPLNPGIAIDCPGLVAAGAGTACTRSDSEVTPRVVLDYKPDRDHMVYASWSRGFTAGGFNNFATVASTPIVPLGVPAETISNFELGTKNDLFDRKVRLNLSLFQSNYHNLQIRQAVNTGGVAIVPVEKARIRGLELELLVRPFAGLTLAANGAHTDAKILKGTLNAFPSTLGVVPMGSTQVPVPVSVAGNSLTRAPHWQGNLSASYDRPVAYGHVGAGAALRFQSATWFQETNQDISQFRGEAWKEVDLHIGTGGKGWELTAYVNNLFDTRHATQIVPFFILPNATLNPPRTIGASLSLHL